MYGSVHLTKNL